MWKPLSRIMLFIVIVLAPAVLATFFGSVDTVMIETGRNAALLAFVLIVLQFFTSARIKWTEKPFGLDILIRFHKYMAILAAVLLILHPLLLAFGGQGISLLIGLKLPWYIWLGKIALVVLLVNALLSKYQSVLRLKFENWRFAHDMLGPSILVLGFVHSFAAGNDLSHRSMQIIWIGMVSLALLMFVRHRLSRPWALKKYPWRVVDVRQEVDNVWTIKLAPPEGKQVYAYAPGQFHFITFYRGRGLPVEEHHWTISSSPMEKNYISSTIKKLGDFTATIKDTQVGDLAAVHGPFGRFSYVFHPGENDLVFLAGGIGITPLMSMLRHMRDQSDDRSVLLIYGNAAENQIVFRQELAEIEAGGFPRLRVVHVLSRTDDSWTGETGHIEIETIKKYCGDYLDGKTFYVCGPPGMVKGLLEHLETLGISHQQVRLEIFSFLD